MRALAKLRRHERLKVDENTYFLKKQKETILRNWTYAGQLA